MSSTSDERWRTPRGQQPPPPQNQNRQSTQQQRQNSSRERASGGQASSRQNLEGFTAVSGNAWANNDRGNRNATPYGLPQEQNLPVANFNSPEVRDALKKAYTNTTSEDMKALKYKAASGQVNSSKGGGPWGVRPNTMGNGKDFFLELRKQLSTLQQGGERAGG